MSKIIFTLIMIITGFTVVAQYPGYSAVSDIAVFKTNLLQQHKKQSALKVISCRKKTWVCCLKRSLQKVSSGLKKKTW